MKKWIGVALMVVCCVSFLHALRQGVFNGTVEGTEQVWYGTVTDRAMDKIDWNDRFSPSRPYIGVALEGGGGKIFWRRAYDRTDAQVGDYVRIDSAVEKNWDILVAVKITVLEKNSTTSDDFSREQSEKRHTRKLVIAAVAAVSVLCALFVIADHIDPIPGTEEIWTGTVTGKTVKKGNRNARFSRWQKYIHIITESGEEKSFRFACWCDSKAVRGDAVEVETAIEKRSGLPIVTKVTVIGKKGAVTAERRAAGRGEQHSSD